MIEFLQEPIVSPSQFLREQNRLIYQAERD